MFENMFEKLMKNFDLYTEIESVKILLFSSVNVEVQSRIYANHENKSVLSLIDQYYFFKWKQKGRATSSRDMLNRLQINNFGDFKEAMLFVQFAANMCNLVKIIKNKNIENIIKPCKNFNMLWDNILAIAEHFNCELVEFKDEEKVLLIEKNPAASAVADIIDSESASDVIEYNHFLMKGDLNKKKKIILALANKIEPNRKKLKHINSALEDNLYFLLNNMNLRHNNVEPSGAEFNNFTAKMNKQDLEIWYDEAYQLELLAILLVDNIERNKKIELLKEKIK